MTGRITALFLALFIAGPALSEPIRIRSGEHENFTRIVLDLPNRVEWKISEKGGKAVLAFTGQKFEFDTSAVFNRLSEGRLEAISGGPGNNALTIELGCKCELAPFWYGQSSLVVDIRDVDEPAPEIEMQKAPVSQLTFPRANPSTAATLMISEFSPDIDAVTTEKSAPAESNTTDQIIMQAPGRDMKKTRETLLRQIGRAASQGLLSPNMVLPRESGRQDEQAQTETTRGDTTPSIISEAEASKEITDQINLRAQSSIDRGFLSALAQTAGNLQSSICIRPNLIDVAAWGTDEPFAGQIGAVRVRLSGEFDKTSQTAALELIRLYLYFGFGVEAAQALKLITSETRDTELLKDLAAIFEQGYAPDGSQLAGQLNCGAPISLWSALSYQTLPTDVPVDDNSILLGFNALPPHLRSYLGPVLSRRFLEAGHRKTSDRLLRILDRNEETTTPDSDLVKAEIDIAEGAPEEAEEILDDVVITNTGPSAKALLLKIETVLESGRAISFETAQLAGAYAQENRDEDLGRDLYQAYVVSLAASGAFDQSYREYIRLNPEFEPDNQRKVLSRMLGFLTANANDMTFLKYAFAEYAYLQDDMDTPVINATAKRLLSLGFTTKARQILAPEVAGEQGRIRALLRAEISLIENRPRQADVELLGLTGDDVNLLRAQARSQVGEHKAAALLFASANQPDMATREALLAEDWDIVLAANNPVLTDVAMLVKSDDPSLDADDPTVRDEGVLAQDRALIEASNLTRSTIENLLQSQPGPDAQNE